LNPEQAQLDIQGRTLYHKERLVAWDFIRFAILFNGARVSWHSPEGIKHKHLVARDGSGAIVFESSRGTTAKCYDALLEWACNSPRRFPRLFGRKSAITDAAYDRAKREAVSSI